MRTLDEWFDLYGESHQNPVNKAIHVVCVPAIVFSILGMLWAASPYASYALVVLGLLFYLRLSFKIAIATALMLAPMLYGLQFLQNHFVTSVIIFVVAWIGQFIGHGIEGKKPSFLQDLQFLMIGPIWVLGFIMKKMGMSY